MNATKRGSSTSTNMIRRVPPRAAKRAKQPRATPQEYTSEAAAVKLTASSQRTAAQQVKVANSVEESSQSEAAINSRALKAVRKSGRLTPPHQITTSDSPIAEFIAISRGSAKKIKISVGSSAFPPLQAQKWYLPNNLLTLNARMKLRSPS
jgi:rhamnose utilization protein RhaD (predicted bifunctional aldolase and dehydrogenase)